MVRSSGHHKKRSRSRSASPDHKRSKSSRDYDKDRLRRRSRSRDRTRRSRSRDRNSTFARKDKRDSESRFRSKPLRLKHRSRSRSRSRSGSKSKEKSLKKEEKKDVKVDDEPFDPTNLDKVLDRDDEDEWVVTDVIEEPTELDNGTLEEEYDYEADEDDQYSHSSASQPNSPDSRHRTAEKENNVNSEIEISSTIQDVAKEKIENKENGQEEKKPDEVTNQNSGKEDVVKKDEKKEKLSNVVDRMKESTSNHKKNVKSLSRKYESDKTRRKTPSYRTSYSSRFEDVSRLSKDHIKQCIKLDKELHELRLKHEIARHKTELEVLKLQLDYWNGKLKSTIKD